VPNIPPEPEKGNGFFCGDRSCNAPTETSASCPIDCPAICGDKACTRTENAFTCPTDCGTGCGDLVCQENESPSVCPTDCGMPNETVIFNQTIDYREIVPGNPIQIIGYLKTIGLTKTPIETIDAATKNFSMTMEFSERKTIIGGYQSPQSFTTVSVLVKNNQPQNYTDVEVLIPIPKEAASSANQIQSPNQYTVIQQDPALQFILYKLPANGEKLITFSLPDIVLTKEQSLLFSNPIITNFRLVSAEELSTAGCHSDSDCSVPICFDSRCIDQECYKLRQPPGTSCGPGLECTPNATCQEKRVTPYNQPRSLLELPSLILIIVIFGLAVWIIKEYASE
jgi:hypothetical protein